MMSQPSIARRLIVWFTLVSFLMLLGNSVLVYWLFHSTMEREDDLHLIGRLEMVRRQLPSTAGVPLTLKEEIESQPAAGRFAEYLARILTSDGQILAETPGMSTELPPEMFGSPNAWPVRTARGVELRSSAGQQYRALSLRTPRQPNSAEYIVQIALNRTEEKMLMARLRLYVGLFLAVALVACAMAGKRIAAAGLRPISQMIATAARVRSTRLKERVSLDGLPVELSGLAETFNEMMDRLEESFVRLSQFSSNIAHELRTPVNNLRGELEVALSKPRSDESYRETLASALEECDGLSRLIDGMLFLARAEDPSLRIDREPIDVQQEVQRLMDYFDAVAAEAGVKIALRVDKGTAIVGNRLMFQRAVSNVMGNALAHSPRGSEIVIRAAAAGDFLRLVIEDQGAGIAPHDLPHVFDRFYRGDRARLRDDASQGGLGLAIVKSIMQLHGGIAEIESRVGHGTRVILSFPSVLQPSPK